MIALNTKVEEQARQEEELAGLDDTEKSLSWLYAKRITGGF